MKRIGLVKRTVGVVLSAVLAVGGLYPSHAEAATVMAKANVVLDESKLDASTGVYHMKGYDVKSDGSSYEVEYTTPRDWNTLKIAFSNCDYTTYDKLYIDMTPARGGMLMGIAEYSSTDPSLINHTNLRSLYSPDSIFADGSRTMVSVDIDHNMEGIALYFDIGGESLPGFTVPSGKQKVKIHSIEFANSTRPEMIIDGSSRDWKHLGDIDASLSNKAENAYGFYFANAFVEDDVLYIGRSLMDSSLYIAEQHFLDVDGNPNNGYQNGGADYYIGSNGDNNRYKLYKYTGTDGGWSWTDVTSDITGACYSDKSFAEIALPLSLLDNYCGTLRANIGCVRNDWSGFVGRFPETDSNFFEVPVFGENQAPFMLGGFLGGNEDPVYEEPIYEEPDRGQQVSSFYGKKSEWDSVDNDCVTKGNYKLKTVKSQDRLYTLVESKDNRLNTTGVYCINVNNDTGYTYNNISHVDYVVKEGKLYRVSAKNSLTDTGIAPWFDYYKDNVEMQLYLEDIGANKDTCIVIDYTYKYCYASGNDYLYETVTLPTCTAAKKIFVNRDSAYYYPKENFDSLINPAKGWATNATNPGVCAKNASDLYYVPVLWREFEPADNQFSNIFAKVPEGKKAVIRFIMDSSEASSANKATVNKDGKQVTRNIDIPVWLYEATGRAGTFYDLEFKDGASTWTITGYSPDYDNSVLKAQHKDAVKEIIRQCKANPGKVAYIQIGSIGHWGEMHTWPQNLNSDSSKGTVVKRNKNGYNECGADGAVSGKDPSAELIDEYIGHYIEAAKNDQWINIGVRKPFKAAAVAKTSGTIKNGFGLFNDMFGVQSDADNMIKWSNEGTPKGNGGSGSNSAMPEWWKTNYSGGEFAYGNPGYFIDDLHFMDTLNQVRQLHTTFLGPCSAASEVGKSTDDRIKAMSKLMGYNFAIDKIKKLDTVSKTGNTLDFTVNNEGVAPFYFKWNVNFALLDSNNNVVCVSNAAMLNKYTSDFAPGLTDATAQFDFASLPKAGKYTLAISVRDSKDTKNTMNLALFGKNADGYYGLYEVTVK
ncbi:MAG: DUF4832 domain-containing protein [Lachnospiraceae bacterium]|nr:DUF4832 domain-containing protein [Lachnospiraceae bacterium]